jgi:putative nucleotidyltransferase with HDIG domain
MELLSIVDQEDADLSLLAKKVSHDLALTAKTLQLANSPMFATGIKVATVQQAITLLGFDKVRALITRAALTGCFPERICKGFDHTMFWHHSKATAIAASILARHIGLNENHAFTAGLLHDIGRLVLVSSLPDDYATALACRAEQNCSMIDAEQQIFGADHTTVGELLAVNWNFSNEIRLAIACHHQPDRPGGGFLAAIVHIANAIVHQLASAETGHQVAPAVSAVAWKALNLNATSYAQICRETQARIDQARLKL